MSDRSPRWLGAALFAAAFAVRLFFWQASPDAGWPGSASYQGDAWTWLEHAAALQAGRPFELGLPLRPPGMAYLLAAIWIGGRAGLWFAGLAWAALGALAAVLFYGAARLAGGERVGVLTGLLCAGSSGLMILSTSLNNETPYLVLLGAILWLGVGLRREPRTAPAAAWGALNGMACLFRVEHALFFGLALLWLARSRPATSEPVPGAPRRRATAARRTPRAAGWWAAAVAGLGLTLVLVPWHRTAWGALERLNEEVPREQGATARALAAQEGAIASLPWSDEAATAREALPAFLRRPAATFVAATVAHRGGDRVTAGDFAILEDAFGYRPRPLPGHPFVVVSGGLNFALANHGATTGGFDPRPLSAPPPLRGGPAAYPPALVAGLPPAQLALTYPGHLRLINDGYRVGWEWIASHPGDAVALAGRKLAIFWRGATLGLGGWNLPLGAGGLRRPVDLATPEGAWPTAWRWLLAAATVSGVALAWRRPAARLWLLFLASKAAVTVAFYGYARQGATAFPVVALALAFVLERPLAGLAVRRLRAGALAAAALLVFLEGARALSRPQLAIDGRSVAPRDVPPPDDHAAHTISWR